MNRRLFGQLLVGASTLGVSSSSVVKTKVVPPDTAEIEKEQAHLADLQDWLSNAEANPYSTAFVPGIKDLIALSETRLKRLQSSV